MGKKLEGNGLYESSRMIIPQHREAILRQERESKRRVKPILNEQQWEMIEQALRESLRDHASVTLQLFGPFEYRELRGIVNTINTFHKEIRLYFRNGEWELIKFEDIIAAEV
ncbi:YolD-like family protein [Paenibacillus sp. FA6]|uniref:YolD-like family protein n=1 Tax=Paenibacillus sp. FA6 TaxID=3413029 RepID=UPI003F65EF44